MPRSLGTYAQWQLSHASTPLPVLAELVRRATGTHAHRIDRIMAGYSNEVYRAGFGDEQDVVIRILRFDDDSTTLAAAGEAAAIRMARAAGVPAPEILLQDTVRIEGSEFPVMVQRAVPGRPLGEVIDHLSGRQRHDVLVQIGGLIGRMSGIQIHDERDWQTVMAAELADRYAERNKVFAAGISGAQFDRIIDLLEAYARDFPCEQWVLCHGDLSLKHIFVTGEDSGPLLVGGIIDFGDWQPGAPVHDLAVLRARSVGLDVHPLLAGYGPAIDEAFRRRLDLHTLMMALRSLEFGVAEHDQMDLDRSSHLIRTLIADLDGPRSPKTG